MSSHSASDGNAGRDSLWVRLIVQTAVLSAIFSGSITIVSFAARWSHLCDLATHWKLQFAIVAAVATALLLLTRRRRLAALAGLITIINVCYLAPLFLPRAHGSLAGKSLRVISANILSANRDSKRFLEFVEAERPDLLLVMEVNDRWAEAMRELDRDYPYSIVRPRSDNFGIALFSRHPIASGRVEFTGDSSVPTIVAAIDVHGLRVQVLGAHPLPPIGRGRRGLRDRHLQSLGELASQLPRPVILLGDLNTTSWSPSFVRLLARGDLRDSRNGFGVQPTWPTHPRLLRIPIDHALISADLVVTRH
jgi:endonuclease/exonuclease/phosphatase (EEP) superfamily protein YafD